MTRHRDAAPRDEALERAFDVLGKCHLKQVAEACHITPSSVSKWRICPHWWAPVLEGLTGGRVTRHELAPRFYPNEPPGPAGLKAPAEEREQWQKP